MKGKRSSRKKRTVGLKTSPCCLKWYTAVEVRNPATGDLLNTIEKKDFYFFIFFMGKELNIGKIKLGG